MPNVSVLLSEDMLVSPTFNLVEVLAPAINAQFVHHHIGIRREHQVWPLIAHSDKICFDVTSPYRIQPWCDSYAASKPVKASGLDRYHRLLHCCLVSFGKNIQKQVSEGLSPRCLVAQSHRRCR